MKFYYGLVNNENKGYGFILENDPRLNSDFIELTEEEHQKLLEEQSEGKEIVSYDGKVFTAAPGKYYVDESGIWQLKTDAEYEAGQAKVRRERLDMLSLTAADVERAIYKAKGIDFEDVIEMVRGIEGQRTSDANTESYTSNPPDLQTSIDLKALKIELKANNFYRGNPYVNQIGALLGYTSEDLDYLFENGELKS